MADKGENLVSEYFSHLGLDARKISEEEVKTPDFEVYNKDGKLLFYAEEKTIDESDFLNDAKSGEVICVPDSSFNTLQKKFRTSVQQFRSVNEHHLIPNVLVFVNQSTDVNFNDLIIALTGKGIDTDGEFVAIRPVGRVKADHQFVDLCLWFDKDELTNGAYVSCHTRHTEFLENINFVEID
ncbi:hypothetical protein ACNOIU_03880 [Exiguobacterium mexicanum]|uniref:Uncharacterized protein n=1 Tax=Exiguobacterium mexicanum TaxID=340146 RepID=A0ABT7MMW0_9BACL|nr:MULTISPECIES: hypothetical protein [Exiguobacterium]MDL5376528.1 hypothetical protein [Exiguobacterium mexicanum]